MSCKEPGCNYPGEHIHLSPEDVEHTKQMAAAFALHREGAEIERTRNVSIHNYSDLLDHLKSDNGHMMSHAEWRNGLDEHIPGVRPMQDEDRQLTHQELIALHHHDHNQYPDMEHTTLDGEHFHH